LTAGYGDLTIVRDVSLSVCPRETVGLVGLNGSGKSTVLNAIMGITWGDAAGMSLDGDRLDNLNTWQRRSLGIGFALQRDGIFRSLTVAENLKIAGMSPGNLRETFYGESLRSVARSVADNPDQEAGTLSGGEQRVLSVAMALSAGSFKVLLADEPSLGLAPDAAHEMLEYIGGLSKGSDKRAVLLVSHERTALAHLCDRVYAMKIGFLSKEWDKTYLKQHPEAISETLGDS
jgi:branched-chain amino acid transport system ATP-binding protein